MSAPDRHAPPRMQNYAVERNSFSVHVPERFNAVRDVLATWAAQTPDELALLTIGEDGEASSRLTVSELHLLAIDTARALLGLGLAKGDRIMVMLPRSVEWYAIMLGAMRIGAVPMPAPNMLTAKDIAYRIEVGNAVAIVTDGRGACKVESIGPLGSHVRQRICVADLPRAGWLGFDELPARRITDALPPEPTVSNDPLLVYFTSGTVGPPKMVEHVQSYALAHIGTARFWQDLRAGDLHWTVSDTGWAKAAWGGLFGQWLERAAVVQVVLPKPDAALILSILARHRITSFCAPPTLYRQLILADFAPHDLSALRHCTSAGEPLNPEVIRAWKAATGGLEIYDGYGQTESAVLVANFRCNPVRPGSMGRPVPGYDVTIVDDDAKPVASGATGNVAVGCNPHPIGLFRGYGEGRQTGRDRFRNGYYLTGDRAFCDDDGYFWFEGREDDVITSSAYRIGPFEVESALIEHAAVTEAGVVGKADPMRTEIVCAFVRLAPGFEPSAKLTEALQNHVRSVTAPYKYPREILYVSELPKTISGKIRRSVLREWLTTGAPDGIVSNVPGSVAGT